MIVSRNSKIGETHFFTTQIGTGLEEMNLIGGLEKSLTRFEKDDKGI
jgi:hypothetical protein